MGAKIRGWLQTIIEATQVIQIDLDLAGESARASIEPTEKARKEGLGKPGLGDAMVLPAARMNEATVLTGDPHFKGLQQTQWLGG